MGNKTLLAVILLSLSVLITDILMIQVGSVSTAQRSSVVNLSVFTVLTSGFAICQFLLMRFIKNKTTGNTFGIARLRRANQTVSIIQYMLLSFIVFIIFQLIFTSSYSLYSVTPIVIISMLLSTVMLGSLVCQLIRWIRSNRNLIVLSYSVAVLFILLNTIFTLLYLSDELVQRPLIIKPSRDPIISYQSVNTVFREGFFVTNILSFLATYAATLLMLLHYSKKLGRIRFIILIVIPLAYFLLQFDPFLLTIFSSVRRADPVFFGMAYNIFFSVTRPIAGIFFSIAFWSLAQSISNKLVKEYMALAAISIMLVFGSNYGGYLAAASYPPFGITSVSFMGISSYLLFVGLYSSVISAAQDVLIRKEILKSIEKHMGLLGSLAESEIEQKIETTVMSSMNRLKSESKDETYIESSLEKDDISGYVKEVITEITKDGTK